MKIKPCIKEKTPWTEPEPMGFPGGGGPGDMLPPGEMPMPEGMEPAPGGGMPKMFGGAPDAQAAVHIKNGKYEPSISRSDAIFGGDVSDSKVSNLKVVSYDGKVGGIFVEGPGSNVEVYGAVVSLLGDGKGLSGPAVGIGCCNHANLTVRDSIVTTGGFTRCATSADENSVLRVYDSTLISHGIPYGEGYEPRKGFMAEPPAALEISGNTRVHCTMSNSFSYFYNCTVVADGWAALSTDMGGDYVYLEANDCRVVTTKSGYGAYADGFCHDRFNRCQFDVANMAAIAAGQSSIYFTDTDAKCGSYFMLMHSIGSPTEVTEIKVMGGKLDVENEVFLLKSTSADIAMDGVDVRSKKGVLVRTEYNVDPNASKCADIDSPTYGYNLHLSNMSVDGDIINGDDRREFWADLESVTINGAMQNVNLALGDGSFWFATADSKVSFTREFSISQVDAPVGITVYSVGGEALERDLPSGGRLVMSR